jgi:hypothetical protein
MVDISNLSFPELYQMLLDAGRLRLDPETDTWRLDGAALPPGTDYVETFRRAMIS